VQPFTELVPAPVVMDSGDDQESQSLSSAFNAQDQVILTWSLQSSGIKESIAKVEIPAQRTEIIADALSFVEPPSNPNSADEVRATEQAEQALENFMISSIANVAGTFSMQSPPVVYQPDVPSVPQSSQPQRQSQGSSM
jgi:hypothetical protein